jgi:hypothetical protein
MKTDTPETDTAWASWPYAGPGVHANFARKLERERNAARAQHAADIKELNERLTKQQSDMLNTIVELRKESDLLKTREKQLERGCIELSYAIGRIDYLCDEPNEMEVSEYDVHQNESIVVERITKLLEELKSLRRWKSEQLAVETSWDEQKVGKLLNLPIGSAIRPAIQPAIEGMINAIKEAHDLIRWLIPNSDGLHHRTASAAAAKLEHFIK